MLQTSSSNFNIRSLSSTSAIPNAPVFLAGTSSLPKSPTLNSLSTSAAYTAVNSTLKSIAVLSKGANVFIGIKRQLPIIVVDITISPSQEGMSVPRNLWIAGAQAYGKGIRAGTNHSTDDQQLICYHVPTVGNQWPPVWTEAKYCAL